MNISTLARHTLVWTMLVIAPVFAADEVSAPSLVGRWHATVVVNGVEIPFEFEIAKRSGGLAGSFFNGDRRITSTGTRADGANITFDFGQYSATLDVAVEGEALAGEYRRGARVKYPFKAIRAQAVKSAAASGPAIAGTWIVPARSSKGETAWRFIVRQDRGVTTATILRVDGDTGSLTGGYRGDSYVLSHFSGSRPLLLEVTPQPDGTLALRQNGKTEMVAVRETDARAGSIGAPADPATHTTVGYPAEPFKFSFPDLNGRAVSNTDAQFAGKVVLVNISGSWCPNCHDEAPFLAALYKKYRDRGLEVVTFSFEEDEQLQNPTRLRAFIATYGLQHTILLAGTPDQLTEKVPQASNLNAFPTTFIIGRDGRVRGVHAGFPSPGSGEFYRKAEQDVSAEIERLLAEPRGSQS